MVPPWSLEATGLGLLPERWASAEVPQNGRRVGCWLLPREDLSLNPWINCLTLAAPPPSKSNSLEAPRSSFSWSHSIRPEDPFLSLLPHKSSLKVLLGSFLDRHFSLIKLPHGPSCAGVHTATPSAQGEPSPCSHWEPALLSARLAPHTHNLRSPGGFT